MPDVKILNPWDSQGNQITDDDGVYHCVRGCGGAGYQQGYVLQKAFCMDTRNAVLIPELSNTVQAKPNGGRSLNCTPNVIYPKDGVRCLTPWDIESIRTYDANGAWHTLYASSEKSGLMRDSVVYAVQMDGSSKPDSVPNKTPTLTVPDKQSKVMAVITENSVEGGQCLRTTPTIPATPARSKSLRRFHSYSDPEAPTHRSS